ncbi:MAG: SAM-dependent methyltransferase [Pirellulales bacterium]|nr:SAM-dependent methyltransferase [Pirellulales bacterium]
MADPPQFLFVTCQVGAEPAVKGEVARRWPEFRFAFSRPGFLTFKLPKQHRLYADFDLESVFARAYGFSLGKISGDDPRQLVQGVWEVFGQRPARRIHVWPRDSAEPGDHDFEPSITPAAAKAAGAIRRHCPCPEMLDEKADDLVRPAARGDFVLDCVLVEPDEWWVGYHRAASVASRWPGGIMPLELPAGAVSRAWLKMEEALRWSELPMAAGAQCAELGSAPGGASQALLDRGLIVMGIDPAEMHPDLLAHPRFTHIRRRAVQVRRRQFRKIRWLTVDMNVAPNFTLDAVEAIVTHPEVHVRGMLLTLKLPDWKLAEEIPEYLGRVRAWGYNRVAARQLVHNRREVCVAAIQKPFRRRLLRGK